MIPFIEKTWFFWWILAALAILRWFHMFSSATDGRAVRDTSVEQDACKTSDDFLSGTASRLST